MQCRSLNETFKSYNKYLRRKHRRRKHHIYHPNWEDCQSWDVCVCLKFNLWFIHLTFLRRFRILGQYVFNHKLDDMYDNEIFAVSLILSIVLCKLSCLSIQQARVKRLLWVVSNSRKWILPRTIFSWSPRAVGQKFWDINQKENYSSFSLASKNIRYGYIKAFLPSLCLTRMLLNFLYYSCIQQLYIQICSRSNYLCQCHVLSATRYEPI